MPEVILGPSDQLNLWMAFEFIRGLKFIDRFKDLGEIRLDGSFAWVELTVSLDDIAEFEEYRQEYHPDVSVAEISKVTKSRVKVTLMINGAERCLREEREGD